MDNVIPFPLKGGQSLARVIAYAKDTYAKAGLSLPASDAAIAELESLIKEFLSSGHREFVMDIPAQWGLSAEQAKLVGEAHDRCMKELVSYTYKEMASAINVIIGVVGSKYAT